MIFTLQLGPHLAVYLEDERRESSAFHIVAEGRRYEWPNNNEDHRDDPKALSFRDPASSSFS
jgi:hypothetical protein